VDKNVLFDENIQTKEFDQGKPVNLEAGKVRNFIQHNKKKIRSRSKNQSGVEGPIKFSKSRQRTAMKNVQEMLSDEDIEFYHAEDQCC